MKRKTSTEQIYIDPVCLKTVSKGKTAGAATYRFRTYYFCTPACRSAFEKDPEKYLELSRRDKGGWVRYLTG
ncbi:MAG: YHS domain-containing protein [Thermodesulfobacteriota bacterium]